MHLGSLHNPKITKLRKDLIEFDAKINRILNKKPKRKLRITHTKQFHSQSSQDLKIFKPIRPFEERRA
jgi:hypothetical protein